MAKRFQFNLEPVLKLRTTEEEKKLLDLAEAQGESMKHVRHIDKLAHYRAATQDEVVNMIGEHADFRQIIDRYRFINTVNLRTAYAKHKLEVCRKEEDRRRQIYLEARKKKEALEFLKERRKEAHRREEEYRENKELDELGIRQFYNSRAEREREGGTE